MTEKALVAGNMKALNKYFPAYKRHFGYFEEDQALSKEQLEQRKQKLFRWVQQTLPTIDEIHQFITQSEQNASAFLPYYTTYKQQTTQSTRRIPFQDFQKNVLTPCVSCRQSIQTHPEKNQPMRQQIRKIKTILSKLHTTKTVPRQQQLSQAPPKRHRYHTRRSSK